ncbi:hypothetical protein M8494_15390 [Serratia ureilytica]
MPNWRKAEEKAAQKVKEVPEFLEDEADCEGCKIDRLPHKNRRGGFYVWSVVGVSIQHDPQISNVATRIRQSARHRHQYFPRMSFSCSGAASR